MNYPTVTERFVRLEPVGHDPFIDSLGAPAGRREALASGPPRPVVRPRTRAKHADAHRRTRLT